jgi:rRNA maturation protein Rpf1
MNQLNPVIKNDIRKESKNLNDEIFLNRLYMKKIATVNPTKIKAAGPFVIKANPKKNPANIAVVNPILPTGLLV